MFPAYQVNDQYTHMVSLASSVGRKEYANPIQTEDAIPKGTIAYISASSPDKLSIELQLEHFLGHLREEAAHYLTGARLLTANIAAW
jgi:hypothetical protein